MMDCEKNVKNVVEFDSNSDDELLTSLLPLDKKTNHTLSSDELTAQGILFFIAGYDTTSASLSHAIYYLAKHRDCQQRLYEELQTYKNEGFTYENLNKFKYLNAVINETLRLAPPLLSITRECIQEYKLGNTGK